MKNEVLKISPARFSKIKILTITGHYLPGFRGGGPIRSIANLVECLDEQFRFLILTSDRDFGSASAYEGISVDSWNNVGAARVKYLPAREMRTQNLLRQVNRIDYDILYVNSIFLPMSVKIMLLRRLRLLDAKPVILAPRGELSPGAMSIKTLKKRTYLYTAKILDIYSNVHWQVSSQYELEELLDVYKSKITSRSAISVVQNLPTIRGIESINSTKSPKKSGYAKIIFLSRISRKKNLDVALEILRDIVGSVEFDIYGPIEDREYWSKCQRIIANMPENVTVNYRGDVQPEKVIATFSQFHLFLFPTRGENYGRVIIEALSAGCLVLVSDQTPWRNLQEQKLGWDIPINDLVQMKQKLAELIAMDRHTFDEWSEAALLFSRREIEDNEYAEAHKSMFLSVLN